MIRCDSLRINSVDNRRVSANDAGIILFFFSNLEASLGSDVPLSVSGFPGMPSQPPS